MGAEEPNQQDLTPPKLLVHGWISQAPMGAAVGPAVRISTAQWGKHGATGAPWGRNNTRGALLIVFSRNYKRKGKPYPLFPGGGIQSPAGTEL